ncbi:MAG TPA: hypothetical protein VLJ11_09665 [Bryobacteraceae bacterium]|nr:hypothetical protein [Bryobacteraceae bacterium]
MFLDPTKLSEASPRDVLEAAANGHLGLDQRLLHALLDREEEALPAVVAFAERDRSEDAVDLAPELLALFRHWSRPEAIPFLIRYIKEDPEEIPDEAVETLVAIGKPALEPLLSLYEELHEQDESASGEVAFILASLRVRDGRILKVLEDRLPYDFADTALLMEIYGDPAAIPAIEKAAADLGEEDQELRDEISRVVETLRADEKDKAAETADEPFDIWALYPEEADLPMDLIDEDERAELLEHPVSSIRAAAASSFFNRDISPDLRKRLLKLATSDDSSAVRARAWEALTNATDEPEVIEAMLNALRKPNLDVEERGGLLVGLAPEADRNEVRKAIADFYTGGEGRAKALEAMWRSMHPSFRDYFAKHLHDADLEVRRGAVWGVGYYGLKSELSHLRELFDDEDLRSDALFAYSLAMPTDLSPGRMKGLLARIEKDAKGLSEMEEQLVMAALDERLMLAGKEPFFARGDD